MPPPLSIVRAAATPDPYPRVILISGVRYVPTTGKDAGMSEFPPPNSPIDRKAVMRRASLVELSFFFPELCRDVQERAL